MARREYVDTSGHVFAGAAVLLAAKAAKESPQKNKCKVGCVYHGGCVALSRARCLPFCYEATQKLQRQHSQRTTITHVTCSKVALACVRALLGSLPHTLPYVRVACVFVCLFVYSARSGVVLFADTLQVRVTIAQVCQACGCTTKELKKVRSAHTHTHTAVP